MRSQWTLRVVVALLAGWLTSGLAFAGAAGGSDNTTTTTTTTTNVNTGTFNAGSLYQGSVTVSGAMRANVVYTWGRLRASQQIINELKGDVNGTSRTALRFYENATSSLPSNLELLTASVPLSNPFLYYQSSRGSGFQDPTSVTSGTNALGVELEVIGGRTARWSETVSGPSNYNYAIRASTSSESSSTSNLTVGDFILGSNTNINTAVTNYSGTGEVSVYQVSGAKYVSPIVLDVKGMGRLEASNGAWLPHPGKLDRNRVIAFDFNANGFDVLMEWVGPDDGLLVEPKPDGTVDGSCLFGTTGGWLNGYEKLSLRDKNGDLKLTGSELDGLCVWQDRNGNGKVDDHELTTLKDLGITEINLNHQNFQSTFVMNGATHLMWDWWPSALNIRKINLADLREMN